MKDSQQFDALASWVMETMALRWFQQVADGVLLLPFFITVTPNELPFPLGVNAVPLRVAFQLLWIDWPEPRLRLTVHAELPLTV